MYTRRITVKGRVQGVFFRQSAVQVATQLCITGWVKNLADGDTVAMVVTGAGADLEDFVNWCRQGPSQARVTSVEIFEMPLQEFEKFSIL